MQTIKTSFAFRPRHTGANSPLGVAFLPRNGWKLTSQHIADTESFRSRARRGPKKKFVAGNHPFATLVKTPQDEGTYGWLLISGHLDAREPSPVEDHRDLLERSEAGGFVATWLQNPIRAVFSFCEDWVQRIQLEVSASAGDELFLHGAPDVLRPIRIPSALRLGDHFHYQIWIPTEWKNVPSPSS